MAKKRINAESPWVEKYRPKSINDMALPTAKVSRQKVDLAGELTQFVQNFFKEIHRINEANKKIKSYNRKVPENKQKELKSLSPKKAAVLLEGPPGIGKTSIVYALANDLNMEVIETNASDTRTRDALEKRLKETSKSRGIMDFITESKQKLILIDEVDGIYGTKDRGAVPAIMDIVSNTQFPIIMCSNEYKRSLQSLYREIRRFEVSPLSKREVNKIAGNILQQENITGIKPEVIEFIIKKNSGDLRGVINDLQGISQGLGTGNFENADLLNSLYRDSTEEIFTLIRDLFQKVNTLSDARNLTDKSDVDYNFLYKWVHENIPTFLKHNEELAQAYENLSLADEIFGRIRKNQYWALLPYFYDLFAGGVVLSRKQSQSKGFRRITNPKYISSGSLNSTEKALIEKIQKYYEISENEAIRDFVPFLRNLSQISMRKKKELSDWLDLNAREKKVLKK